jgi:hypothetical protein
VDGTAKAETQALGCVSRTVRSADPGSACLANNQAGGVR